MLNSHEVVNNKEMLFCKSLKRGNNLKSSIKKEVINEIMRLPDSR